MDEDKVICRDCDYEFFYDCRHPGNKGTLNYITGKRTYPECKVFNYLGKCTMFKPTRPSWQWLKDLFS